VCVVLAMVVQILNEIFALSVLKGNVCLEWSGKQGEIVEIAQHLCSHEQLIREICGLVCGMGGKASTQNMKILERTDDFKDCCRHDLVQVIFVANELC
jgi:hypothetical protein